MRTAEQRETFVGAIAAVVLAVGLLLVALTNRAAQRTDDGLFHLLADFDRVDGVHVGTPVRVAGVDIGAVAHMSVDSRGRALLSFRFDEALDLPDDTAAVIETDGLFGQKYVELRPGGSDRNLKNGARISFSQDAVILEDLVALIVQRAKAAQAAVNAPPVEASSPAPNSSPSAP
ncbi:MAG: MCE family protein [Rhodospirillaceae bacterium]|nr:MCE family protein [Rhodospirillaceae bacterium]